jgi:hypothetical protein
MVRAMRYQHNSDQHNSDQVYRDRRNDVRFLTPLLLMAVVLAAGILLFAYAGHALAAAA